MLRAEVERIVIQEHAIRFEKNDVVLYVVVKAATTEEAAELAVALLKEGEFDLVGAEPSPVGPQEGPC